MLPPKNNCTAVAATVPTVDQINTLYARFSLNNSQALFQQVDNALMAKQPENGYFGNILQIMRACQ